MTRFFPLLLVLFLAPAFAQDVEPRSRDLLVCYPNAPGSQRQAKPVMDRFGQYLERLLGAPCVPTYFNELTSAKQWLQTKRPRFAILSLSVYLRWREEHGLRVVSLSERQGSVEQRFYLLVMKDSPHKAVEDLTKLERPARIWSTHLDNPRFATRVVFGGKLQIEAEGPVRAVSTRQPLRALRRMKKGEQFEEQPVDAVLVDSITWAGLQKLKRFKGLLRVLHTSPSLPTPPVVAFEGASEEQIKKLGEVLGNMRADGEGKRILKTLQVTGFEVAPADVMSVAVAAYAKESGK